MPVGKRDKLVQAPVTVSLLGSQGTRPNRLKLALLQKRLPRKLWPGNTVSFNYSNDLLGVHK